MKAATKVLSSALVVVALLAFAALSVGCAQTATTPTTQPPVAVTPSTPATTPPSVPATEALTGLALGKMIYETGNDNAGVIPTKFGIAKIKVNSCKNCHGDNGKGGKPLAGVDIRGVTLKPDFDEAKFAVAVTTGVDDGGKKLKSQMPHFQATPEDTAALWLYVNSLK